ncbi:MAG: extradiol dioxygenase [Bauldia sp.]|nr:extradiol dioxygenase [Bauldia sp.]
MLTGTHLIIYSRDPEADRAFFRDVLGIPGGDAGDGWLALALPPAEIAFQPAERDAGHEIVLICDDVDTLFADLADADVQCAPIVAQPWGRTTRVTLPGGSHLRIYQPSKSKAG